MAIKCTRVPCFNLQGKTTSWAVHQLRERHFWALHQSAFLGAHRSTKKVPCEVFQRRSSCDVRIVCWDVRCCAYFLRAFAAMCWHFSLRRLFQRALRCQLSQQQKLQEKVVLLATWIDAPFLFFSYRSLTWLVFDARPVGHGAWVFWGEVPRRWDLWTFQSGKADSLGTPDSQAVREELSSLVEVEVDEDRVVHRLQPKGPPPNLVFAKHVIPLGELGIFFLSFLFLTCDSFGRTGLSRVWIPPVSEGGHDNLKTAGIWSRG